MICFIIFIVGVGLSLILAARKALQKDSETQGYLISAFVEAMNERNVIRASSILNSDSFQIVSYAYREFAQGRLAQLKVDIENDRRCEDNVT
jgi:hypothetical protein